MKKYFLFLLIVPCIAILPAFRKGKDKAPAPSDGVKRIYKSKPVKKPKEVTLPCGIKYTVTAQGDGPMPEEGDGVKVLYKGMLTNDTVFDASYLHGNQPFLFHLFSHEVISGWDSVVCRLHGGDKARMTLPAPFAYGARAMGKIPANSTLVFEVEIVEVIEKPTPWDAKGKDTITTKDGLKIIMFESYPDSLQPKAGQMVLVDYSGYFLDGKLFDSSVERAQPIPFTLGMGQVIKGWDEGIGMLHKGEKAKLIVPYDLAYGVDGGRGIPPKATLIFDVHLIDIKTQ